MVQLVQYCPVCHKRINVPKFINMVNVVNGITIECADKKCKGKVKIKTEQKGTAEITTIDSDFSIENIKQEA